MDDDYYYDDYGNILLRIKIISIIIIAANWASRQQSFTFIIRRHSLRIYFHIKKKFNSANEKASLHILLLLYFIQYTIAAEKDNPPPSEACHESIMHSGS